MAPKPTPTGNTPAALDLNGIAAQYGVSPAQIAQAATDLIHPQIATATVDPPVYQSPGTPASTTKGHTVPGQASHTAVLPGKAIPAGPDRTLTSSAAYKQFLMFTHDEKAALQQQMFIAGYYGKNANAHDILFGQNDPASYAAWQTLVDQAAYAYNAGQKLTPQQLVTEQASGFTAQGETTDKYGNRTSAAERALHAAQGPKISVTSASELSKMARDLGVSLLGRAATQDEQRLVIAAVQRQERAFTGSGGSGERPAPQAIGEDVLRAQAPGEVDAHSLAANYGQLLKIVGG